MGHLPAGSDGKGGSGGGATGAGVDAGAATGGGASGWAMPRTSVIWDNGNARCGTGG